MSRKVRIRVVAELDGAGGPSVGTIEIDRDAGLISVRRLRCRRAFVLPLASVATMICRRIILAELAEKRAAKRAKRRGRR